jgi:hypothetical protein
VLRGRCANGDVLAEHRRFFMRVARMRHVVESITLKRERFCARIID